MNKNQKTLLGVGVLAVAGYLIYQQKSKNFIKTRIPPKVVPNCPKGCELHTNQRGAVRGNCPKGCVVKRETGMGAYGSGTGAYSTGGIRMNPSGINTRGNTAEYSSSVKFGAYSN